MSNSTNQLNQRITNLYALVRQNGGGGGSQNLNDVLANGDTATNDIVLNNAGTGANVIRLLPNATATNPTITLTDGLGVTNTINKNGYTTRNSNEATPHFLNFTNLSTDSVGAIQKTAGISCVPSTNTITATNFVGNFNITDTNTDAIFYPVFVSGAGSRALNADIATGPLSINPNLQSLNFGNNIKINSSSVSIGAGAGQLTTPGAGCVGLGLNAGNNSQAGGALAIGSNSGKDNQEGNAVAIGPAAGSTAQKAAAVAIGSTAGNANQTTTSVAIGINSGAVNQGNSSLSGGSTAIGASSGRYFQGEKAVAIGFGAGVGTALTPANGQGANAVAIGTSAGAQTQGANAIAIGNLAGQTSQTPGSIAINASGGALNPTTAGCYIKPIRGVALGIGIGRVFYDTATFELQYSTT